MKNSLNRRRYRFGFNGMEKDDEVSGQGNSYDFGARMYNSRLGRFSSTDPYMNSFTFQSPYLFAGNSPINSIDYNGLFRIEVTVQMTNSTGQTENILLRFNSNNPHKVRLINIDTRSRMNLNFKTQKEGRGGTSLSVMENLFSDKIDPTSVDVQNILEAQFGEYSVTEILSKASNENSKLDIIIIGNDGISGLKRESRSDRNVLVGRSYWKNSSGQESYYYNATRDNEWVIVHFDGSEERFSNRDDMNRSWFDLESQYTLTRAQTVGDTYFANSGADINSRYSLTQPKDNITYKGMELLPASRDGVGITIGFDLTRFNKSKKPPKQTPTPEHRQKSKHPRWL